MTGLLAAWNYHRIFRFDVWGVLFWVNVLVLGGIVVGLVVSVTRDRVERPAANLVPFLDDDELEGARLERVLGWSLVFITVFALTLAAYWLRETARENASVKYFNNNAVSRGEALFSNENMPVTFDPAKSLKCANCHGVAGSGGSGAPYTYIDPTTNKAYSVTWRAPALNTVLYRFSPQEVHDIITYGRPGTPMQPWGVLGGGPKNDQSINDLVAYIESIQLPPGTKDQVAADMRHCDKPAKTALGASSCALVQARNAAADQVASATADLKTAKGQLTTDQKAFADSKCAGVLAQASSDTSDARVKCRDLDEAIHPYTDASGKQATAKDVAAIADAQSALDWAKTWQQRRANVTDGQLLFEINCARCHTKNWSIFDPSNATLKPEDLLGLPGGGGSLGFNLRDGEVQRRFPQVGDTTTGKSQPFSGLINQIAFVINGSDANKAYGVGGIGSGRMPGQCNDALKADSTIKLLHYGCMLTYQTDVSSPTNQPVTTDDPSTAIDDVMIEQIVLYERCGLEATDSSLAPPKSDYASNCS